VNSGTSEDASQTDIDGEGVPYGVGVDIGADEFVDTDSDGLSDRWEGSYFGDLSQGATGDPDSDGLGNLAEYENGTDPTDADTDDDGLSDYAEVETYGTNPRSGDTDGDGMPDAWETVNSLNPVVDDSLVDADGDGYSNYQEYVAGTDPQDDGSYPGAGKVWVQSGWTGVERGTSEEPYDTIQEGIDAAVDGQTVVVRAGVYRGEGNRELDFGGKRITVKSEMGAERTVIDCEGLGRGFWFHSGEDSRSVVDGFTVRGGSSVVGGAVYLYRSSPVIRNCIFERNESSFGGALCCDYSSPEIVNTVIWGNESGYDGGGIYCYFSAPRVINCTIFGNRAVYDGGGLYTYAVTGLGGGAPGVPVVVNTILWGNTADSMSEVGGPASVSYSVVRGGYTGEGNMDADPQLVSADYGQYRLTSGSPCIDVGRAAGAPVRDLGGDVRPAGAGYDIGADEYVDTDSDGLGDDWEMVYFGGLGQYGEGDPDGEGLQNGDEYVRNTNPAESDTDDDGLSDGSEVATHHTDPRDADTDGDETPDGWEVEEGFDPLVHDSRVDADGDGYNNYQEYIAGTDPNAAGSYPVNAVIWVWSGWSGVGKGTESEPYRTIQEGLDAASDGMTVVVKAGTYTGEGNRGLDFGGKRVVLTSEGLPAHTIIDCEGAGRAFSFDDGESLLTIVRGFTVKNGADGYEGGGMLFESSSGTVERCIISGCVAGYYGGGVQAVDRKSSPELINCVIACNTSGYQGGGVNCGWLSSVVVMNCTVSDNSSAEGGGLSVEEDGSATVVNTIVWGNNGSVGSAEIHNGGTAVVSYSVVGGGYAGDGNIDADPLFVDAARGDYHIGSGSPCIEAGRAAGAPSEDIDGETRPIDVAVDIGADERNPSYVPTPTVTPTPTATEPGVPTVTPTVTPTPTVTATPGPGLLLFDDFNDGNMDGWTVVDQGLFFRPSDWQVKEGRLAQSSLIFDNRAHRPGTFVWRGEQWWTDYYVRVQAVSRYNGGFGVMLRYVDANNYYRFSIDRADGTRRLEKVVNGVATVLAQSGGGYALGGVNVVEVRAVGSKLEVYLNCEKVFEATDGTFSSGAVGLYSWADKALTFDNVFVGSASADSDNDGIQDIDDPDSDNDGYSDYIESVLDTSPVASDVASRPAVLRINFQPGNAAVPSGYVPDHGASFSVDRAFGWPITQ